MSTRGASPSPCTPHRRGVLTAENMAILERAYETQAAFVHHLVLENVRLSAVSSPQPTNEASELHTLRGKLAQRDREIARLRAELAAKPDAQHELATLRSELAQITDEWRQLKAERQAAALVAFDARQKKKQPLTWFVADEVQP